MTSTHTSEDNPQPPNISTGSCCLYCRHGSFAIYDWNEEFVRCNKYETGMAIAQICDDYQDSEGEVSNDIEN